MSSAWSRTLRVGWGALLLALLVAPAVADPPPSVLLAAMGDIQLGRSLPAQIESHGAEWLWDGVRDALAPAALRFANLECPVTTSGRAVRDPMRFRGEPEQVRAALADGGIGVVSTANNHAYDHGREGVRQTIRWLHEFGLAAPGTGTGRAGAIAPVVVRCHDLRIAFVAYTDVMNGSYEAPDDDACVAMLDEATLADEIAAAKSAGDVLVVSVHWGEEYHRTPTERQTRLAHALVDAGADAVLGHHPHVTEPTEVYAGKPICYSLGNCIFDRSGPRYSSGLIGWLRLTPGSAVLERTTALRIQNPRPFPKGEDDG